MKSKAVVVNQNGEFLGALPNQTLILLSSLAEAISSLIMASDGSSIACDNSVYFSIIFPFI